MKVLSAVASNIGNLRESNEDNFYFNGTFLTQENRDFPTAQSDICSDGLQFYAICDGMGGEEQGEDASLIAVSVLKKYHKKLLSTKYHNLDKYIDMYLAEVNTQICELRKENDNCRIGTTIAMFVVEGESIHIINIGDSRIYKLSRSKLIQLTEDHTPAVRAFKMGLIKEEDIKTHPHRNKLTQYLGLGPEEMTIIPSRLNIKSKNNERFLICSDGITDMIDDSEIKRILRENKSPELATKKLIEKAKANGGRDNITAIVLDIKKENKFLWF